jgi:hypothetical protein
MIAQHKKANQLRASASWYRTFAERAVSPVIWEDRLRTAEDLEDQAARFEIKT